MAVLPFVFEAAAHQAMSNFDLALDLARQGIAIFPCHPDGEEAKRPYPGVFWRKQSTTSDLRIRQWWDRWPDALPAIDLAKADRLVIDLDGVGGISDWQAVSSGRTWAAPTVDTPSGGRHLWFRRDGRQYGNGRGSLPPKRDHQGIDVRGHGGYVIAPGATMLDGRRYEPNGDDILSASSLPEWLAEILAAKNECLEPAGVALRTEPGPPVSDERKRSYGEAALEQEISNLASAAPGGRNETANLCAFRVGQLVGGGCLNEQEAYAALHNAAASWGVPAKDKALGPRGTIARAIRDGMSSPRQPPDDPSTIIVFDNQRRVIQAEDGTLADAETGEVIEAPDPHGDELPGHLANPPGLVGALTRWICNTARRPETSLAIGAALVIVGTAAGRHIVGPTRSGTHLYVVGLAPTGAGKDHAMQQILMALSSVGASHLIGPSQFISMPAVINFLVRKPLSVCAMDEFGAFLKRIGSRKASGFEGAISGMLRTAWSSSFKPMPTPEWAGRQSETIVSPAMSIYGVSTAEEFYGALEGGDMSNGLLNRLLVVETKRRPKDRRPTVKDPALPPVLVERLRDVLDSGGTAVFAQLQRSDISPPQNEVQWGPGAEDAYAELVEKVHTLCDGDAMAQAFYARVAETATRIATILAIGNDPKRPIVTIDLFDWATGFAMWSAKSLARGGMEHISDSENQSAANHVRRAIRECGGRMKHRDLLRRLNHRIKDRDLREIVKSLAEAEHIVIDRVTPKGGGPLTIWYSIN